MANEGRIDSSIAEAVVDLPAADDFGRVSSSFAEVFTKTSVLKARTAYVFAMVWSSSPVQTPVLLPKFNTGTVPGMTSTLRRRRPR